MGRAGSVQYNEGESQTPITGNAILWEDADDKLRVPSKDKPLPIKNINTSSLNIGEYDYISLTYVASGNGAGEIETITYKEGGAGGTVKAVLTLTYNADDEISTLTMS